MNDLELSQSMLDDSGDEPQVKTSPNRDFHSVLDTRLSRRSVLTGSLSATVAGLFGAGVVSDASAKGKSEAKFLPHQAAANGKAPFALNPKFGFEAIPVTRADAATVPEGYKVQTLAPWGTPLQSNGPAYNGGNTSGADQEQQVGSHHDGMHYFPSIDDPNGHGILCINHEYVDQFNLHGGNSFFVNGLRPTDQVRKEVAAHGVSVLEIKKDPSTGEWNIVDSPLNRRITGQTRMEIRGPVAGSEFVLTKYSPEGRFTRGTLNNCAHGYTPWGTYLTCEENWAGYFVYRGSNRPREITKYGVPTSGGRYRWELADNSADEYVRFNATPVAGASSTEDYRNEPNTMGWVVEIDPNDPNSVPKKRTTMGRFGHEGCWYAPPQVGQPVTFYMGDDSGFQYIYKFVTKERYSPRMGGDTLDEGTLFAARFNDDGSGEWLALDYSNPAFRAAADRAGVEFTSQADVLVNTRLAADVVGATPMDRPEWGTVHPQTREVYFACTNNSGRGSSTIDAANPRGPNRTGHIIRWREQGNRSWATRFEWDLFLLAGSANNSQILPEQGGPALDESNIMASPDGLWFDQFGTLWIQTDMSGSQQAGTSPDGDFGENQMLAANPITGEIRRFLVGPPNQEVTGVVSTPDGKNLFVNFQHPGDRSGPAGFTSNWPDGGTIFRHPNDPIAPVDPQGARPRSSTIVITREDGGVVGLE